jgi:hypothetical protein
MKKAAPGNSSGGAISYCNFLWEQSQAFAFDALLIARRGSDPQYSRAGHPAGAAHHPLPIGFSLLDR